MSDDQPRYTTKRLRDEIARAKVFARIDALEEAATLIDEGFDRPGIQKKQDKCPHDKFEWEDCEGCAAAAIRGLKLTGDTPPPFPNSRSATTTSGLSRSPNVQVAPQPPNVDRLDGEQTEFSAPAEQMTVAKLAPKKSPALAGQELTYGKGRLGGVGQSPSGTRVTHHVRNCSGGASFSEKPNLIQISLRQNPYSDRALGRFDTPPRRPSAQTETKPRQCRVHQGTTDRRTAVEERARQDERHRHHPMRNVLRFASKWWLKTLTCRAYCTFLCGSSARDLSHSASAPTAPPMYANARSESIATDAAPSKELVAWSLPVRGIEIGTLLGAQVSRHLAPIDWSDFLAVGGGILSEGSSAPAATEPHAFSKALTELFFGHGCILLQAEAPSSGSSYGCPPPPSQGEVGT